MKKRKRLLVANWKMNPSTLRDAKKLFTQLARTAPSFRNLTTIICPPAPYLASLRSLYRGSKLLFGSQNVFWEPDGSYTGEHSVSMLKSAGATHCIIGHSERRLLGETDDAVGKKVRAAVLGGLTAIVCFGELERDADGRYLQVVSSQLEAALTGLTVEQLGQVVIAYEPVWAIGKSAAEAASAHDVHQMVLYIKKYFIERFDRKVADSMQVLYGGSVEPGNLAPLIEKGEVDGFLVGRASLDAARFKEMLGIVNASTRQ